VEIQFHSFLTSAVDCGEVSNSCSGRFPPANCLSVSLEFQVLVGAPEPVLEFRIGEKFLTHAGNEIRFRSPSACSLFTEQCSKNM